MQHIYLTTAMYHFVSLPLFKILREPLLNFCVSQNIKGTLLLADEGINGTVAGSEKAIHAFLDFLKNDQKWFDSSLLGVSLNVPIFSSLARSSRTQQAKIELEKARTNLTETEQKLMLQLESAKTEYNYSLEELETSKQNLALAERIENKQQIKFFEGISTSFELTEAQRQLYTMQQNYLQAMLNVIATKAALDNALNISIN